MFIQGGRKWCSEEETASCVMQILYTSSSYPAFLIYVNWRGSPSSLTLWTLVPSLLVIFEGQQRRKVQVKSSPGIWICWDRCVSALVTISAVFPEEGSRFFTWYVSYSTQILDRKWCFYFFFDCGFFTLACVAPSSLSLSSPSKPHH